MNGVKRRASIESAGINEHAVAIATINGETKASIAALRSRGCHCNCIEAKLFEMKGLTQS